MNHFITTAATLNFLLKAFLNIFALLLNYTHHIKYYLIYSKCNFLHEIIYVQNYHNNKIKFYYLITLIFFLQELNQVQGGYINQYFMLSQFKVQSIELFKFFTVHNNR